MKCLFVLASCLLAAASAGYATSSVHFTSSPGLSHSYNSLGGHGFAHAAPFAHVGHYGGELRLVDHAAIAAGAPLPVADTHEVAVAKAEHFKAHEQAKARLYGHGPSYTYVGGHHSEPRLVDTAALAAGAPLPVGDTHEVAHAKAEHFKAHAVANARLHAPVGHGYIHTAPVSYGYAHGYAHAAPVSHGFGLGYGHAASIGHGFYHGRR